MLIINTEVKPSSIHGTGLFAAEKLHEGQIIWVRHVNFDCAFTKKEWELLPSPAKEYLRIYMYWSARQEKYVACLDNSRHMNHSVSPNTKSVDYKSLVDVPAFMLDSARLTDEQWSLVDVLEGFVVTTRAVDKFEELSCNYNLDFPDHGGAGTLDFLQKNQVS